MTNMIITFADLQHVSKKDGLMTQTKKGVRSAFENLKETRSGQIKAGNKLGGHGARDERRVSPPHLLRDARAHSRRFSKVNIKSKIFQSKMCTEYEILIFASVVLMRTREGD